MKRLNASLTAVLSNPLIAYSSILLLQLKVIWGMWIYRDMETGDTLSYLLSARMWHQRGIPTFAGSPLYIAFYGSMFNFADDSVFATIATRFVIIMLLALLMLAVMRSLLSPGIAWLMAAWWVVLPSNFDAMYTIHLFVVIPILISFLAAAYLPAEFGRGACLSLLLAATLLVRYEFALGVATFGAICLGYETWRFRRNESRPRIWKLISGYALPLLLLAGLCIAVYVRALDRPDVMGLIDLRVKQSTCQSYAFGYTQRHPEWNKSPWTDCPELMQEKTGRPDPTLAQAVMRNPGAMFEHFLWNISLIPNGLEVLLFNAAWGTMTPDYRAITTSKLRVLVCGLLLAAIWIGGLAKFKSIRNYWWANWITGRVWVWTAMGSLLPVALYVMITQRPRPAYIYELSVLILALTGLFLEVIAGPALLPRLAILETLAALTLLIVVPVFYNNLQNRQGRIVATTYYRLRPFSQRLSPGAPIMMRLGGPEVCYTLAKTLASACQAIPLLSSRLEFPGATLNEVLDRKKANFAYFDEDALREPDVASFAASAESLGWKAIALELIPGDRWMLFERSPIQ